MGDVWRALDTETHRIVAVKVLPANLANDPIFAQRFRREALAAAGLTEPHVVPIHNFGEIDGRLYVDMRLVDGRDLQAIIAEGPLEPGLAVAIIEQIASALTAAHRIGLATTIIDAPESCNGKAEREWHWIYLREQPNGTLSGEWIEDSIGCYIKRTATFTRTGDADISSVPDPAKLPPRKLSQALYLHGIYHSKVTVTGASTKPPEEADYSVDTICLRDGDRCLSRFLQTDGSGRDQLFIFENGAWTRNTEQDSPCPAGGTSHTRLTAVFPMPDAAPDPIVQLTGGGLSTVTGSACTGGHYDEVFTRTGDDPIPR